MSDQVFCRGEWHTVTENERANSDAMTTQTATPTTLFQPPTLTVDVQIILESLATYYDGRRDGLLRELAAVEKEMGLGTKEKPTTAQIRDWWRKRARKCPRCGVEL